MVIQLIHVACTLLIMIDGFNQINTVGNDLVGVCGKTENFTKAHVHLQQGERETVHNKVHLALCDTAWREKHATVTVIPRGQWTGTGHYLWYLCGVWGGSCLHWVSELNTCLFYAKKNNNVLQVCHS